MGVFWVCALGAKGGSDGASYISSLSIRATPTTHNTLMHPLSDVNVLLGYKKVVWGLQGHICVFLGDWAPCRR